MMPFPFGRLPPELRLEIWDFAVWANARPRRVVEQNLQVYPTLDLVASPLFSVNSESREIALSFYPVRLEVYRRDPENEAQSEDTSRPPGSRGFIYLSPELDDIVSVHQRAAIYHSELSFELSERSKMTAWLHHTLPMSEETRQLFRRHPDRWCLMRYASGHFGARDWMEVQEWMLTFGEEEYRSSLRLLRSMRINTGEFAQVFGWR
ncbi:hypothetical protein GQX73_g2091 [Xylaria multiplex]|uniref:2EXR domain-containing protein n=1 Tax=Xylaria multiplex TaxID=323545 RepID=A0A7C8MVL0_9PEZI|nr:hypothetical protein GQX73_g2091 [Xylaria multiplex]